MAGAEVDFEAGSYVVKMSSTSEIIVGPQSKAAVMLTNAVTPARTKPLFVAFGIEFIQSDNGVFYPLKNGVYNLIMES